MKPGHANPHRALTAFALVALAASCGDSADPGEPEVCEGFPDWQTSSYVLPFPAGGMYRVLQGNCSPPGNGHRGVARYGYDFDMQIGTMVTAARDGTVLHVEESHFDGEVAPTGFDNIAVIRHADGSVGLYGHFTHDGVLVEPSQTVRAGDALGHSGNTGNTANVAHLHFSVHACDPVVLGSDACASLPVTFRNTLPNPEGLEQGRSYPAYPFE